MSIYTPAQQQLPTGTWGIDPVHSQVGFAVKYLVGTFRGGVSPVEGALEVDSEGHATLKGSAGVSSIRVQDENLAAHLGSPEFFDADRTPMISFATTYFRLQEGSISASGELTIKGVTQPVELKGTFQEPLTDPHGNERVGLTLSGVVDRTKFGLGWNAKLPNGEPALANEVQLTAELYFVKG